MAKNIISEALDLKVSLPYDETIKKERENYEQRHSLFLSENVRVLASKGYDDSEISKIMRRTESYIHRKREELKV